MFFIGIFGIENKDKEIKILNNLNCKKCNSIITGSLIKNFNYFHLFFIPLFKWNEKYYVLCNNCKTIYTIPIEKGKSIERGEKNINITYWDLQEISDDNYTNNYNEDKVCKNCGKKIDNNFIFCPHCGTKCN